MTDHEQIESALRFLDSEDREDWVRVGMAIQSALGDDGKELWFRWSAQSEKFRPRDAEAVWRSFRGSGIGLGTLFKMARQAGWTGTWEPRLPTRTVQDYSAAAADTAKQHAKAAETAARVIAGTVWGPSAYLLNKGFTGAAARGLKQAEDLIIPMRDYWNGKPMAFQRITPAGGKKYQPMGCRVSETCYIMNKQPHPSVQWWCEGYATGMATLEALHHGYRYYDQVVVCFSASNLRKLAAHPHRSRYHVTDIVIADHDWWRCRNGHQWDKAAMKCPKWVCKEGHTSDAVGTMLCSKCSKPVAPCAAPVTRPAGQMAARGTGLPWWMPPEPGTDAADYWKAHGPDAFSKKLLQVLRDQGKTAHRQSR